MILLPLVYFVLLWGSLSPIFERMNMFKSSGRMEGAANDTVIASGVKVEGDFTSAGNIVIEGEVIGSLKTDMDLVVGPDAKITASVVARNARISGEVRGNIVVAERMDLSGTARIVGDVQVKTLVIEAGAVLDGRCTMAGQRVVAESTESGNVSRATVATVIAETRGVKADRAARAATG